VEPGRPPAGPAPSAIPVPPARVSVVVITRDRRQQLLETLSHLVALPERPPIIVVDNGSSDGTPRAVAALHPAVRVVSLPTNVGATARNLGVGASTTPYVAFADDDSWWAPGALAQASGILDLHQDVAVVAGRTLVGPQRREDPLNALLAASPLGPARRGPGPEVLGFLACSAVVRRHAFLAVGGFDDLLFFAGEEELLALDLAEAGWRCCYDEKTVAHHHPRGPRDGEVRRARLLRNEVLTAWLRRPAPVAYRRTRALAVAARRDPVARLALWELARHHRRARARRRRLSPATEAQAEAVAGHRP